MTIGEVVDRAVTLLVRRARGALVIAVAASLPSAFFQLVLREGARAPFLVLTLRALQMLGQIYGIAALVALFAGRDPVATVREGWLRLLRTAVVAAVPIVATGAVVATVLRMLVSHAGPARPLAMLLALAVFIASLVPTIFLSGIGVANAVLEGTRATASVLSAYARAFATRERRRTVLLAYATTMTYVLPIAVLGAAVRTFARSRDMWWPLVALPPLEYAAGVTLYGALLAVAAQDYATRREGRDLEGVLDGLESA
jgi:hypothetical protein